jgi:hypothetical protein
MTYFSRSIFALVLSLRKNKEIRYNYIMMYLAPFFFLALSYINVFLVGIPMVYTFMIKLAFCSMLGGLFYLKYKTHIKELVVQFRSRKK